MRDQVQLNPQHLQILRHAMLQDTEHPGANGYDAFHHPTARLRLPNFHVAGKTGTAQVNSPALDYQQVTWFDSYGPYEDPRYAVVVMVVDGGSGGETCAPVAEEIYEAIVKREQAGAAQIARWPAIEHARTVISIERKRDFDWPLLLAAAALAVVGVLFIFSATEEASQDQPLYQQTFFLQIIWCAGGVGGGGGGLPGGLWEAGAVVAGDLLGVHRVAGGGDGGWEGGAMGGGGGSAWAASVCNPRNLPRSPSSSCWRIF